MPIALRILPIKPSRQQYISFGGADEFDNTDNLKDLNRRKFSIAANSTPSVSTEFDSFCAVGATKHTFNVIVSGQVKGITLGPISLGGSGGVVSGFKLNSASSGQAGTFRGQVVNYNTVFTVGPSTNNSGNIFTGSNAWSAYSKNYVQTAGGLKSYIFRTPGMPLVLDDYVSGVTSIDVYLAQSGFFTPEVNSVDVNPLILYTIGDTDMGIDYNVTQLLPSQTSSVIPSGDELAISFMSIIDKSSDMLTTPGGGYEFNDYDELDNLRPQPGKSLQVISGNSSSIQNIAGFSSIKDPGLTKLKYKLPISLANRRQVATLQLLMQKSIPVFIMLFEETPYEVAHNVGFGRARESVFSRYARILSPINIEGVAEGYYNLTLELEEI